MRRNFCLFRPTASVALAALLLDAAIPPAGVAQPAPPPLPQPFQTQPSQAQVDPPARVGRLARVTGTASFRTESDDQWSPASVNYPVSTGDAFWTQPSASAELEISASRITMAATTEFDIATLDANGLQAVAAQGEVYLHLRDLASTEAWSVQTPRGLVHLNTPGRYFISVGSTEQPTRITVLDGSAQVEGPDLSLQVGENQTATIDGITSFQGSVGPAVKDAFLIASLDAERPRPAPPVPIPAQVAVMPGGSDLTGYGNWSDAPEYGQVWYPPVSAGWVPYREGHWAYVAPWGWTWIDDAPWGFAPFHYGRWVEIGGRWAWTPGRPVEASPPVYAPALVTFIGIGAGVAVGAALAARSIGWVPLGPHEPYRPWYHASEQYTRNVNVYNVTNVTNNVTNNTFVNQHAATAIPGADMARSRPVQAVAQPVTPQQFAAARPIIGQQPLRPTAETTGITPAVARSFNLPSTTPLRPAPGPAIHPQAPGPGSNAFARPPVAPPMQNERVQSEPGGPAVHPVAGSPPLQPNHPPLPNPAAANARPAVVPVPHPGQPPQIPPAVNQRAEPAAARPGVTAPAVLPATPAVVPGPAIHQQPRPVPQATTPPHPEAPHPEPPHPQAPHPEPPHPEAFRPEAPRPEAQRIAPPVAAPRVAVPVQAPRPEPARVMPRPEPPHPAAPPHPAPAPAPAAREKRPGQP